MFTNTAAETVANLYDQQPPRSIAEGGRRNSGQSLRPALKEAAAEAVVNVYSQPLEVAA